MKRLFLVWEKCANPHGPTLALSQPLKTKRAPKICFCSSNELLYSQFLTKLLFYRTVMIYCIMVAVMTQFPLEALNSGTYTLSGLLGFVVFELLRMMLFAFSMFYWTCGVINRGRDPTLSGPPDT